MTQKWFNRMKADDPERDQQILERMKQWNMHKYQDPEYRARLLEQKREAHKLRAADPEWKAKRNAYELARRQAKKAQAL